HALPLACELREDLNVVAEPRDAELTLVVSERWGLLWVFDPARLDEAAVAELAAQYAIFVERALAAPDAPLVSLSLLSDAVHAQIATAWNATEAAAPDACVHQLFEAQARRTPHAAALSLGADALTYAQLDERANQWAHHLRELGVGPEVVV